MFWKENRGLAVLNSLANRGSQWQAADRASSEGTVISHEEAVQTLATEKYLLGELHPEVRDQFEEHLYECQECAFDLWTAATFLAHAKVILSSDT
jgi:hypothetical protein